MSVQAYHQFIEGKSQLGGDHGFTPTFQPGFLVDFQAHLVDYAVRKGLRFQAVNSRLSKGWSVERAISQPLRGGGSLTC